MSYGLSMAKKPISMHKRSPVERVLNYLASEDPDGDGRSAREIMALAELTGAEWVKVQSIKPSILGLRKLMIDGKLLYRYRLTLGGTIHA